MFSRVGIHTVKAAAAVAARRGLATVAARRAPNYATLAAGTAVGAGAIAFGITEAKAEGGIYDMIFGSSSGPSGEWVAVAKEIKDILEDDANHGPFFIRLAWHCAGSYQKSDNSGGSNGATMRFAPEADHGGNAGLGEARDLLEAVKAAHPTLTYADIYTFAGKVSAETMGCPTVAWKEGRADFAEGEGVTPDGRLPDAAQGAEHLRDVFNRMGFNDQEIVALSGAHCLGFCHDDRSGFSGPWTDTPTEFNNKYFTFLLNKKWVLKKWDGPAQYVDAETETMMMLPTDMALLSTPAFRKHVDVYAADEAGFKTEFARVFGVLMELGVPRS
jgi:cytochrome c peroxidase